MKIILSLPFNTKGIACCREALLRMPNVLFSLHGWGCLSVCLFVCLSVSVCLSFRTYKNKAISFIFWLKGNSFFTPLSFITLWFLFPHFSPTLFFTPTSHFFFNFFDEFFYTPTFFLPQHCYSFFFWFKYSRIYEKSWGMWREEGRAVLFCDS